MKNNSLLILITFMFFSSFVEAQDIHFSQFYNTPTFFNPAVTGAFNGDHRISLHYRSQWGSIGNGAKTYSISYDTPLASKRKRRDSYFGVGINAYGDNTGTNNLKTTSVEGLISYNMRMSKKSYFTIGVNSGFNQHSLNASNLEWDSQYNGTSFDANLPTGELSDFNSINNINLGSGLLWSFNSGSITRTIKDRKNFQLGVSFSHIIGATHSFENDPNQKLDLKYVIHGTSLFDINNTNVAILPSFFYQKQGPSSEILVGSLFKFSKNTASSISKSNTTSAFYLGAHYRFGDAIIPAIQFEISQVTLGLSYDINLSEFSTATNGNGGFELSLKFIPSQPKGRRSNVKFM